MGWDKIVMKDGIGDWMGDGMGDGFGLVWFLLNVPVNNFSVMF